MVTKLQAWEGWLIDQNAYQGDASRALETSAYGKAFSRAWEEALKEAIKSAEGHPDVIQKIQDKL